MELHIKSEFECAYLINGEFYERADSLTMSEYDVVYITALPLKHSLLPYTVKLSGAESVSDELCFGTRLDADNYLLCLSPRHMTVYSTASRGYVPPPQSSPIARLFSLVKSGDLTTAYDMLSEELKGTLDKNDLDAFFADFERVVECYWENGTRFYLIDKNGVARLHSYTLKDEFIDDIVEL